MATFNVLLPVKDCKAYLAESITSIKKQSFRDWRLLVLDHGSEDGSLELAHAHASGEPRIEVHSLPHARGLSGLLNEGIAMSDAKYLLRQDADDVSEPNRMEVLNDTFAMDPGLVLAGSLGDVIDARGERIGAIDMPLGEGAVQAASFYRIPVLHPSAAMRLDAMHRLGARYGTDFLQIVPAAERLEVPGLAEDYYLFGQLSQVARCLNINRKLIKFRWHDSNISKTKELAQLRVAVDISRYLANSFATMHDVALFDPAPFSNHGMRLLDIINQSDFEQEFMWMYDSLATVLPDAPAMQREMSFRHCIARRGALSMAPRYVMHARRHGVTPHERNTIKSWLLRKVNRQPGLRMPRRAHE